MPQNLGDGEDVLPVGNREQDLPVQAFAELDHLLGVAGRAEREGHEVLLAAPGTADAGESLPQVVALQVLPNDLIDNGPQLAVLPGETFFISRRQNRCNGRG